MSSRGAACDDAGLAPQRLQAPWGTIPAPRPLMRTVTPLLGRSGHRTACGSTPRPAHRVRGRLRDRPAACGAKASSAPELRGGGATAPPRSTWASLREGSMPHRPPPVPPRAICHGRPIPKDGVPAARRQRQFGESARDAASSSRSAPAPPVGERQGRDSRSQPPPCIVRPELQGLGFRRQPDRPRRVTPHHEVDTSPLPRTVRQHHPCWWGAAPSAALATTRSAPRVRLREPRRTPGIGPSPPPPPRTDMRPSRTPCPRPLGTSCPR